MSDSAPRSGGTERASSDSVKTELEHSTATDGPVEDRSTAPLKQTGSEDPMTTETASTPEEWRRLAQLMQAETDPKQLMELAQQLLDEFDKHQSPGSPLPGAPSKSPGNSTSEAQKADAISQGEQHGSTRSTHE